MRCGCGADADGVLRVDKDSGWTTKSNVDTNQGDGDKSGSYTEDQDDRGLLGAGSDMLRAARARGFHGNVPCEASTARPY